MTDKISAYAEYMTKQVKGDSFGYPSKSGKQGVGVDSRDPITESTFHAKQEMDGGNAEQKKQEDETSRIADAAAAAAENDADLRKKMKANKDKKEKKSVQAIADRNNKQRTTDTINLAKQSIHPKHHAEFDLHARKDNNAKKAWMKHAGNVDKAAEHLVNGFEEKQRADEFGAQVSAAREAAKKDAAKSAAAAKRKATKNKPTEDMNNALENHDTVLRLHREKKAATRAYDVPTAKDSAANTARIIASHIDNGKLNPKDVHTVLANHHDVANHPIIRASMLHPTNGLPAGHPGREGYHTPLERMTNRISSLFGRPVKESEDVKFSDYVAWISESNPADGLNLPKGKDGKTVNPWHELPDADAEADLVQKAKMIDANKKRENRKYRRKT